jgi:TRAP-type uncharacterized transport system substrate-binding protein
MELYNWTDAEIAQANETVPFYIPSMIPAGTYPGVDYDVNTLAVSGIMVTNANMSDDLIYEITKAMWSDTARKLLDLGHPKGRAITLETALDGIDGMQMGWMAPAPSASQCAIVQLSETAQRRSHPMQVTTVGLDH